MTTQKKDSNTQQIIPTWNFSIPLSQIKVNILDMNQSKSYAVMEIKNLPSGFGIIIGSALHSMHTYTPGVSPISFKLEGITSRIGVSELYNEIAKEIAGNIRRAKIKILEATNSPIVLRCNPTKKYAPGEKIQFKDFQLDSIYSNSVCEILNPELVLATSSIEQMVDFTITFITGSGYLDEDTDPTDKTLNEFINSAGQIRVDCSFSSVKRYNFEVVPDVVNQTDTLLLTIEMENETPVSIAIESVFRVLLTTIQNTFDKLKETINLIDVQELGTTPKDEKTTKLNNILKNCYIEDLVLDFQSHNELKELGYNSLRDVLNERNLDPSIKEKIRKSLATQLGLVGLDIEVLDTIL